MSKLFYTFVVLILASCTNSEMQQAGQKISYHAVDKADTAKLSLILSDKAFEGQLEINHRGLFKDSGDVNGVIKGDTLKGTFHYQSFGVEKWYRIPIALLKKDKQLIMGVGDMEIYMNMTFFSKNSPIDYLHPKFIFETAR